MPDGKRKRRHSADANKRKWYAAHRARRFAKRFGFGGMGELKQQCLLSIDA